MDKAGDQDSTRQNSKPINEILHEFTTYTTAHGLNRLVESAGILRKLIWAAFCLGAMGMFLFQSYGLIEQYFARPLSTTLTVHHQTVIKFPAVTICNLNMVRSSQIPPDLQAEIAKLRTSSSNATKGSQGSGAKSRKRRDRLRQITSAPDPGSVDLNPIGTDSTTTDQPIVARDTSATDRPGTAADLHSINRNNPYTTPYYYNDKIDCYYKHDSQFCEDSTHMGEKSVDVKLETAITYSLSQQSNSTIIRNLGHQFDNFIYDCTFKGYSCKNFTKYWNQHWNYRYGNCFTFNSGFDDNGTRLFVKEAHKTGPAHGLKLTLNLEQSEYLADLSHDAGANIVILPQSRYPFPDEEGITVMPGRSTSISMRKEIVEREDPFNNGSCKEDTRLDKDNIYSNKKNIVYSSQVCIKSCLAKKQVQECQCAEIQFQSPNMTVCNALDDMTETCLVRVRKRFMLGELDCDKHCPEPCREVSFKSTLSFSKWPSRKFEEMFIKELAKKNVSLANDSISDSFLQVKIYFERLNYELVKERLAYKEENLASDIGGQLGLWIGISVLTACEIIELVFMLIHSFIGTLNRQKVPVNAKDTQF